MDLFILIIGCICLVASILVWLFGGEKYMKWYYQIGEIGDYRKYDKRKFKIVHSSALALVGLCAIWMSFNEDTSIPLWIMIAIVFANYTLIYTVCKKS